MGFRRLASFDRMIRIIVSPVSICWVIVAIINRFIINIIAISVPLADMWRATIETMFIRAITVGMVTIRTISARTGSIWITIAVTISSILVRTVWPVIIRIIIGLRKTTVILWSFRSFLQDGPHWFVISQWDRNPAMVVVYASPLSRVYVHQ